MLPDCITSFGELHLSANHSAISRLDLRSSSDFATHLQEFPVAKPVKLGSGIDGVNVTQISVSKVGDCPGFANENQGMNIFVRKIGIRKPPQLFPVFRPEGAMK